MGRLYLVRGKIIIFSAPVAIILIVWGFPGMIDDMVTWQGWIGNVWDWLTETPTPISWALVVIGIVILLRPQRLLHTRKKGIISGNQENTVDAAVSVAEIIQDGIGQQYSTEDIDELDILIDRGNDLCQQMQTKDFIREPLESVVGNWMNDIGRVVWQIIPKYASYIMGDQGNLTEHEKLPYQSWNWNDATLRISVDRRLSRLREIRSQIQSPDLEIEPKDALQHIILEGRYHTSLTIHKGRPGWPVMYPIRIRNTRPIKIDIVGYDVNILWNDTSVQKVGWEAPSRDASNGLEVSPPFSSQEPLPTIPIQPDDLYQLDVPVNVGQIANRPAESTIWTAKGSITFRCGSDTKIQTFNFNTDYYQFSHEDWAELGQGIRGSFAS